MALDSILVPVDYTGDGHDIAPTVAHMASRLDADVTLLHVVTLPVNVSDGTLVHPLDLLGDGIPLASYLDEEAYQHMEPLAQVMEEVGCRVHVALRHGDPAVSILQAAEDLGVSMIAMGTHGRRGLRRLLEGSVAETVLRQATCPVLIIRTPNAHPQPGLSPAELMAEAEAAG